MPLQTARRAPTLWLHKTSNGLACVEVSVIPKFSSKNRHPAPLFHRVDALCILLTNLNLVAVAMPDLNKAIGDQQVSYWIGLDGIDEGANLKQIVIQAGFDATKNQDGTVMYTAFYEWYPDPATFIPPEEFSASAGDGKCYEYTTNQHIRIVTDGTI